MYSLHPWHPGGWVGGFACSKKTLTWAVSQKLILGTVVGATRCGMSWHYFLLKFVLAVVTLIFKILSGLFLGNNEVQEV